MKGVNEYPLFPPGIEKRKKRSKCLEEAGHFYKKLFIIYTKNVRSDMYGNESIEELQRRAAEFLKFVKRESIKDQNGIFSKPICSIASESTDINDKVNVKAVVEGSKAVETVKCNADVPVVVDVKTAFEHDNEETSKVIEKSDDKPQEAEIPEQTILDIKYESTIDFSIDAAEEDVDTTHPVLEGREDLSTVDYSCQAYALDTTDACDVDSFQLNNGFTEVSETFEETEATKENFYQNEVENPIEIDIKAEEVKVESAKDVQESGVFDKKTVRINKGPEAPEKIFYEETARVEGEIAAGPSKETDVYDDVVKYVEKEEPEVREQIAFKNAVEHYNIYWDSIKVFDDKLNSFPYRIALVVSLAFLVSVGICSSLIFFFNIRFAAIMPLLTFCVYILAFTFISDLSLDKLVDVVEDWKNQHEFGDSVSINLPSSDWIVSYVKDRVQIDCFRHLKWMGILIAAISFLGVYCKDFLYKPWKTIEWIYIVILALVNIILFALPLVSTENVAYFGKLFALKATLNLYKLKCIRICTLSVFGESAPFLIKRTDMSPSGRSSINFDKFDHISLAVVGNGKEMFLFENDEFVKITRPTALVRQSSTTVCITAKIIRKIPIKSVFNSLAIERLIHSCYFLARYSRRVTFALEFESRFNLDIFLTYLGHSELVWDALEQV